jgi:DNA topoisomerase-3
MGINRLWITEKPEMARNLVAGLCSAFRVQVENRPTAMRDGHFRLSNGDAVTFFFGHMLQSVKPEAYLTPEQVKLGMGGYFSYLPIKPLEMRFEPKPDLNKDGSAKLRDGKPVPPAQFHHLVRLLKEAREIVNAGDVDREGQLIVDEMLEHVGIDPSGQSKPVWRLPLVSAREEDIRKQVLELRERNGDDKWVRRRKAALARVYCDWSLGMNASMAFQAATGYRRMSVGRVQTPVLSIVVARDDEIANFRPQRYFVPVVTLADGTSLRWFRREGAAGTPGFDAEGRIIDEAVARRICDVIASGMAGRVNVARSENKEVAPPMPFSASVLASTVAKRFGMTPKEAEKAAQALYEKHKAISYVGTDCVFLPMSLHEDARSTLAALSKVMPRQAAGANPELRSKAWNDDKVDEHHAIIPTGKLPDGATDAEQAVYQTVVKRYIAQFYPSFQFIKHSLGAVFGQDDFRASTREVKRMGWREVEGDEALGGRDTEIESEVEGDGQADDVRPVGREGR